MPNVVNVSSYIVDANPYINDRERYRTKILEMGIGISEDILNASYEIFSFKQISNVGKISIGYDYTGKDTILLHNYNDSVEKSILDLLTRTREQNKVAVRSSLETHFNPNSAYILIQGSLDVSYSEGETVTFSSPHIEDWVSSTLNVQRSANCKVALYPDSRLLVIDLPNSANNYEFEYVKFNGEITKSVDGSYRIIAKPIDTVSNTVITINDQPCIDFLSCNGTVSLNSSCESVAVIVKNKS